VISASIRSCRSSMSMTMPQSLISYCGTRARLKKAVGGGDDR
jgi:hypothetical protein